MGFKITELKDGRNNDGKGVQNYTTWSGRDVTYGRRGGGKGKRGEREG